MNSFNYQMLGRLQSDCEYYLGFGNRCKEHLYYKDEQEHIDKMKELYNSFPNDEKPEWLTYEQILAYEKSMVNNQGKVAVILKRVEKRDYVCCLPQREQERIKALLIAYGIIDSEDLASGMDSHLYDLEDSVQSREELYLNVGKTYSELR